MTKAFRVKYKCGNCGKEWSEEYEAGEIVYPFEGGSVPRIYRESAQPRSQLEEPVLEDVVCPNCTIRCAYILAREPIEEPKAIAVGTVFGGGHERVTTYIDLEEASFPPCTTRKKERDCAIALRSTPASCEHYEPIEEE